MESTIDFFRFREREDFIALFQGATPFADAIATRRECQSVSRRKWDGRPARDYTGKMRVPLGRHTSTLVGLNLSKTTVDRQG